MADGSRLKVALLARAGEAREQLKRAITDLGAQLVVEADPNDLSAGALAAAGATTVLVSVEPAVEAALDRLEDDLLASSLNVMYDEAETTAKLGGWDLNRWARHLAAKLLGCDVLPPGGEAETHQEAAAYLEPGIPTTPAALADDARIDDFAEEINASAADVPSAYQPSDAPSPVDAPAHAEPLEAAPLAAWATPPVEEGDPEHLALDLAALEEAMQAPVVDVGAGAESVAPAPAAFSVTDDFDVGMIDLRGLELVDDPASGDEAPRPAQASVSLLSAREISFDAPLPPSPAAGPDMLSMDVEELTLSEEELAAFGEGTAFHFSNAGSTTDAVRVDDDESLAMDPELAKLAASFDENLDSLDFEGAREADDDFAGFDRRESPLELGPQGESPLEPARAFAEPPPIPDFDFAEGAYVDAAKPVAAPIPDTSALSLSTEPATPAPAVASKSSFDFSSLGGLQLAPIDDVPAVAPPPPPVPEAVDLPDVGHLSLSPINEEADVAAATGVVLVLSGIGGPDAVRQLVRALPAGFPLAVLLQQNLDGGRHDRFVEQLAKISRLPVALAEPTETPPPGAVRVLPEGSSSAGALNFPKSEGVAGLIAAATAVDGAVVVLSGADEAVVEPLKQAMANGTRVLVQDPASCFDAKAIVALQAAGASPVSATDIAARLDAYFPT